MFRTTAISLAITGMVFLLGEHEGAARPAAVGRAIPFHPAVGAARPLAAPPRPAFHVRSVARSHLAPRARLRHGTASGFGLWPTYDYYPPESYETPYGASPYLPSEQAPPIYPPPAQTVAAAPAVQVINIIPYRPGCDTQIERLPWRNGTEKSVRIVRC
jgi:hypothetical protein